MSTPSRTLANLITNHHLLNEKDVFMFIVKTAATLQRIAEKFRPCLVEKNFILNINFALIALALSTAHQTAKIGCQKCNQKHHTSTSNKEPQRLLTATESSPLVYTVVVVDVEGMKSRALLDTGAGSSYASAARLDIHFSCTFFLHFSSRNDVRNSHS